MLRKHGGFTLVEALIAVSILAILAAFAGPSLSGMTLNQQLRNAGLDLSSTLSVARSEALTRNADVTVAPTGGNWAQGWTVTAAGGTVLRRQNGYARIAVSGPPEVIFSGEGRPNSTATPFEVTAAEAAAHSYRCVRMRANGRPYLAKGGC
jgi:type IV fimbrial biogenesis protein FimT